MGRRTCLRNRSKPKSSVLPAFKDTHHQKLFLAKLITAAKKLRATTVEQAQGTCLTMSLEFCLLAKEYGIPVELVMWPVKNEPVFCDHWAVRINNTQVIDLTRIQVENKRTAEVVFNITDYPPNYLAPRFYKTIPLLDEYAACKEDHAGKLPAVLIKNLRSLMLKQDLNNLNHFKNFSGLTTVLISYFRFRFYFYLSQLEGRLHERRAAIEGKNKN